MRFLSSPHPTVTVATARSYNGFGELQTDQADVGGNPAAEWIYTRDKLGRIIEKQETLEGITTTYAYEHDSAGRLVQVSTDGVVSQTYTYDANGNRTQVNGVQVGVYDDQDRMQSYGAASYQYTENGELQSKTESGVTTSYHYDLLGSLMQVDLPGGTRIDYLVDRKNRRIGKQVDGVLTQGFLYKDQLNPIAELDGSGNLVARFVYADKANVPAYMIKGGATYRIISDHLAAPVWSSTPLTATLPSA